jgi:hypothetical protein
MDAPGLEATALKEGVMSEQFPPVTINFGAVKVVGIPGLSLVAIAIAIAFEFPQAGWLLALSVLAGAGLGGALIAVRDRHGPGRLMVN